MAMVDRPANRNPENRNRVGTNAEAAPELIAKYLRGSLETHKFSEARQGYVPLRLSGDSSLPDVADSSEALKSARRAVLLGDVGAGKTRLLLATAHDYAAYWSGFGSADVARYTLCDEQRLPLYFRLEPVSTRTIEQQIQFAIGELVESDVSEMEVKRLLRHEKLLILIDEYCRVPAKDQLETLRALARFVAREYPDQKYVVAARPQDYSTLEAWFKDFSVITLQPLEDGGITGLVSSILGDRNSKGLLQMLSADGDLWETVRNPFILKTACSLSPDAGASGASADVSLAVLSQLCEALLRGAVEFSRQDALLPGSGQGPIHGEDEAILTVCRSALVALAWKMLNEGLSRASANDFERLVHGLAASGGRSGNGRSVDGEYVERCLLDSCILESSPDSNFVRFRSPLFLQCFGAQAMKQALEKGSTIRDLVALAAGDPNWEKSVVFLLTEAQNKQRLIAELVGHGEESRNVVIAAKCLVALGEDSYRAFVKISPTNVDLCRQFGHALRQLKQYGLARRALEDAVKLDPHRADLHQDLGDVLAEQEEFDGAAREHKTALGLSGNDVSYHLGLANISSQRGDVVEAAAQIGAATAKLAVVQAEVHHQTGHLREAEGDPDAAMQEYRSAIALVGRSHYWLHVGKLQRQHGERTEAEETLRRAMEQDFDDIDFHQELGALLEEGERLAEALDEYKIAVRLKRGPDTTLALGRIYRKLGHLAQAEAELQRCVGMRPTAEAYAELGMVHERRGAYADALDCYRRALQLRPEVAAYYQLVGWTLKLLGRSAEAQAELAIAVKLEPDRADYREQLGAVLAEQGSFSEALEHYKKAAALRPSDPVYRHNIGVMHARLGENDAAIKALGEALELCSQAAQRDEHNSLSTEVVAADTHSELGLIIEKLGQWQQALDHYRMAADLVPFAKIYWLRQGLLLKRLQRFDKAEKMLRHAVSLDPDDPEIRAELGMVYEAGGRTARAVEEYLKAVELDPGGISYAALAGSACRALGRYAEAEDALLAAFSQGLESAAARRELALVYADTKRFDAALEQAARSVALGPDDGRCRAVLGRCLLNVGQVDAALRELKVAVALDPDLAEAHYRLATIYGQRGALEEACACAVKATTLTPSEPGYAHLAASFCARLGKLAEGIVYLRRATETPQAPPAWHDELGQMLESANLLEEALKEYRQAAEKDRSPAPHLLRAGKVFVRLERYAEAAETLLRATSLAPADADAHATLGSVLLTMRQPRVALDRYRKACDLAPEVAGFWAGLASTYKALDLLAEAATALVKAVEIEPRNASWQNELGGIHTALGQQDAALNALQTAVDLSPHSARYLHELALAYSKTGRYEEARTWLTRALAIESNHKWHAELGDILHILGDSQRAIAAYENAAALCASGWRYRRKLGLLYLQMDRVGDAVRALESAARGDTAERDLDLIARYALGLCYAEMGRFTEALTQQKRVVQRAPLSAEAHVAVGSVYRAKLAKTGLVAVEAEEYKVALESAERALELNPDCASAHAELGALYDLSGSLDDALAEWFKALALQPPVQSHRCGAASVYLRMKRPDDAQVLIEKGLHEGRQDAALYNQLGLVFESKGMLAEAQKCFAQAVRMAPAKGVYRYNLSRIRLALKQDDARGDLEEAVRMNPWEAGWRRQLGVLYEASGDWERALVEFEGSLETEPESREGLWCTGRALVRLGKLDEAVELLQRALALPGEAPLAGVYDLLAVIRRQQGRPREALHHSRQALKLEPLTHEYQLNLALTLKALGQTDKADAEIQRIATEAPNLAPARYQLGLIYEERGQLQKALREYLQAIANDGNEVSYLKRAARAHIALGQPEPAAAILRKAFKLTRDDPELWIERARLATAQGNLGHGLQCCQKAISIANRAAFHCDLAQLLRKMGRMAEAVAEVQVAISMEPRNPQWQSNLGELIEEQGDLEEAAALYRNVIQMDPVSAEFHRNLGVVLKKQGKFAEAIAELQKALELKPDYPDAFRHLNAASASALLRKTIRKET